MRKLRPPLWKPSSRKICKGGAAVVRGVLFGMDGVLVDTEPFYHAQRLEFLRRMDYTPGDAIHRVGSNEPVIWAALVSESKQLR